MAEPEVFLYRVLDSNWQNENPFCTAILVKQTKLKMILVEDCQATGHRSNINKDEIGRVFYETEREAWTAYREAAENRHQELRDKANTIESWISYAREREAL